MYTKSLYDLNIFFKLAADGAETNIEEPLGWDKVDIQLPRDKVYFGFIAEFIADSVSLKFADDDAAAYGVIKTVYDRDGGDGSVVLKFGYYEANSNVQNVILTANLNLNYYVNENENGQNQITCPVEKISFENRFRTRFETAIDLSKELTLDNSPMTPAQTQSLKLHSKKLSKQFRSFNEDAREVTASAARFLNIQADTTDSQTNEVQENQGLPLGISGIDPRDDGRFMFKIIEAGDYDLSFKASFKLQIITATFDVGNWFVVPRLMIVRGGETIEYTTFDQFRKSGDGGRIVLTDVNCDILNLKRQLITDDLLYFDFNGLMEIAGATYNYGVFEYKNDITILAQTIAADSFAKSYKVFDMVEKLIESATGQPDRLVSSVMDSGGDLDKAFVSNGYQIRNFLIDEKPIVTSLKDCFESLFPIKCLGYGVSTIGGVEKVVIEKAEFFFRNVFLAQLDDVYDYREEHAKDLVFNEMEFGFEKYPDGELNTLDEYNTYRNDLTPIKTYKAKLSKKIKWILSGYLAEILRREQYAENPSTSLTNDDDIFLFSALQGTKKLSAAYTSNAPSKTFILSKNLELNNGNSFNVISDGQLNLNSGKTFTITAQEALSNGEFKYIVSQPVFTDIGTIVVSAAVGLQAEKNEIFDNVQNVFSPETSYNLRWTPKRIIYSWARFISIMLDKKTDSDLIINTFIKNNGALISTLNDADDHRGYEPSGPLAESESISVGVMRGGIRTPFVKPEYSFFKAVIPYDQFLYIKQHLTGDLQSEVDYGFIVYPDDKGNMLKGHIMDMKYQPKNQIAEMQVAKVGVY